MCNDRMSVPSHSQQHAFECFKTPLSDVPALLSKSVHSVTGCADARRRDFAFRLGSVPVFRMSGRSFATASATVL